MGLVLFIILRASHFAMLNKVDAGFCKKFNSVEQINNRLKELLNEYPPEIDRISKIKNQKTKLSMKWSTGYTFILV